MNSGFTDFFAIGKEFDFVARRAGAAHFKLAVVGGATFGHVAGDRTLVIDHAGNGRRVGRVGYHGERGNRAAVAFVACAVDGGDAPGVVFGCQGHSGGEAPAAVLLHGGCANDGVAVVHVHKHGAGFGFAADGGRGVVGAVFVFDFAGDLAGVVVDDHGCGCCSCCCIHIHNKCFAACAFVAGGVGLGQVKRVLTLCQGIDRHAPVAIGAHLGAAHHGIAFVNGDDVTRRCTLALKGGGVVVGCRTGGQRRLQAANIILNIKCRRCRWGGGVNGDGEAAGL